MNIKEIFQKVNIDYSFITDNFVKSVEFATLNSQLATENNIFFAIRGFKNDGHRYISDAYRAGCRCFIVEGIEQIDGEVYHESSIVIVRNIRLCFALCSTIMNDYPSAKINMIGITGTKGKSSVTDLCYRILSHNNNIMMLSTIKNIIGDEIYETDKTTLEADKLQKYLRTGLDRGVDRAVVEVSSHAVTLHRIDGIDWNTGVFTTFSRDHLDLYGDMETYFDAKLEFFRILSRSDKTGKKAVINIDDPKGPEVVSCLGESVRVIRVGRDDSFKTSIITDNDYLIHNPVSGFDGISFDLINRETTLPIKSCMRGDFNINNIALACVLALEEGVAVETVKKVILNATGVEGRFEVVKQNPFIVIVDYAHSPDSITKILQEAAKISKNRVISIFGCTGDRDKEKRPIMGEISADLADFTIITNDDTYTEPAESIAKQVEAGLTGRGLIKDRDYTVILDRSEAILYGLKMAKEGDVIIVAGMGHQKKQILKNGAIDYNDKETIVRLLKSNNL